MVQQLLRLGSHASLAVFGGNNEVEQSLDWYQDTSSNPHLYATDYAAFFVDTIGGLVHKVRRVLGQEWVAGARQGVRQSGRHWVEQCVIKCIARQRFAPWYA